MAENKVNSVSSWMVWSGFVVLLFAVLLALSLRLHDYHVRALAREAMPGAAGGESRNAGSLDEKDARIPPPVSVINLT